MTPPTSNPDPLYQAILLGRQEDAAALVNQAVAAGKDPLLLVNDVMIPAMDEVGRLFACDEYFVPELLLSGRAMKAALEPIKPLLARQGAQPVGRVVIGTAKGDLHDIGKNLVAAMLEWGGFEVTDLGVDVSPEQFLEAARARPTDLVAISSLLTTTMPAMAATVEAFQQAGLRGRVKVMIGGAPVTQRFADEIGADGYGENATLAVTLARRLLGVPAH